MKLTQEEIDILRELARTAKFRRTRRKREADFDAKREERQAYRRKVGELINRYEAYLQEQDNVR